MARVSGEHLGIPIRFGLNDIVVNYATAPSLLTPGAGRPNLSYQDFQLSKLIHQPDLKIGLWNWYLPTLAVLLLTEGVSIRDLWQEKASGKQIQQVASIITGNPERFICFDQPEIASDFLVEGRVATVLGGGGWLMPLHSEKRRHLTGC
jgi:hypothetical protein